MGPAGGDPMVAVRLDCSMISLPRMMHSSPVTILNESVDAPVFVF